MQQFPQSALRESAGDAGQRGSRGVRKYRNVPKPRLLARLDDTPEVDSLLFEEPFAVGGQPILEELGEQPTESSRIPGLPELILGKPGRRSLELQDRLLWYAQTS